MRTMFQRSLLSVCDLGTRANSGLVQREHQRMQTRLLWSLQSHALSDRRQERQPRSSPSLDSRGLQMQSKRGLLQIPILGLLTPKLLAAFALKKTIVVAIVKRYGLKGTFDILRQTNDQLGSELGPTAYPPAIRSAVQAGLGALEMSISRLETQEQAEMIWKWLKTVDPTLLVEFYKRFVTFGQKSTEGTTTSETIEERKQSAEKIHAIKEIASLFPEVERRYHIILVEKDPAPQQNQQEDSHSNKDDADKTKV